MTRRVGGGGSAARFRTKEVQNFEPVVGGRAWVEHKRCKGGAEGFGGEGRKVLLQKSFLL